ncbi:hypothetical protein OKW45_004535 [Paraburkholderia sp. WSM4175]
MPLPMKIGRRDRREVVGDRAAASAAELRIDADRRHQLVRLVHVQQVLEADAEVVEAGRARVVLRHVPAVDRHRQTRRDQLVVLEAERVDALVAVVAGHALMAVLEVGFVADAGVVDGKRRGEYAVARDRVRLRGGRRGDEAYDAARGVSGVGEIGGGRDERRRARRTAAAHCWCVHRVHPV